MPQAPFAQRQVVDQAVPGVRVGAAPTAQTYGEGIGDTVSNASVRMYDLQTRSSDHAAVVEAETRANAEQLRIQQDVLGMKGKDASNAPQYAQEQWDQVHQDILGSLANDRQKAMYHSIGLQKGEIINRGALSHFNQEDERYQNETYQANLSSSVNVARANAESPVAVAFEKDLQQMRVDERATKYGYAGTPQHDEELLRVHSTTNKEVIHGLLDKGQDLRAKAFYDQIMRDEKANPTKLQFTAQDRDVVDKAIFEGSTRGVSRRTAQDLIGQYGIETAEQRKQIKEAVNAIKDDKVADLTMQRIEHEFSAFDQLQNQVKDERFKGAVAGIDQQIKAGNKLPALEMVRPSDLAEMSVQERHVLEEYVKHRRDPGKIVTDLRTWADVNSMKDSDLAKLGVRDIMALSMKLDDGNRDSLMTRWNGVINAKNGKTDKKYEQLLTNDAMFKNAVENSGYFPIDEPMSKWSEEKLRLYNNLQNDANRGIGALEQGASVAQKEKVFKDTIDRGVKQKYRVKPSLLRFYKDVPAGIIEDYKDAYSIRVPLEDIPVDRQNVLKGALKSAGMPVTTQNIEELEAKSRMKKQGVK
jgi:hypothetical protein